VTNLLSHAPILLLGGGRMGAAMLTGWRKQALAPSIVVDPAPAAAALAGDGVQVVASLDAIPAGFNPAVIVLAVKPQVAAEALPGVARFAGSALVVTIMAGRTIDGVQALTQASAVVRAMPNTPAAIGQGFTAAFAGPGVSEQQRTLCEALLRAIGDVAWVDAEAQLDAVTATSGGGPAYVFLLTELLADAAIEQGLPPALAHRLARATVAGSGALLAASDEDPAAMRRAVTSPGGTTEQALAVLMAPDAWPAAMSRAIAAATARSRALSQ
jgi:pyrroline-5-carboxylate reductase